VKPLALQAAILAHLRSAGRAATSRELTARFLRIERGDEETCRRLLAPILADVPEIVHRPSEGWVFVPRPRTSPARDPGAAAPDRGAQPQVAGPRGAALGTFVALAADGAGPGGSGSVRTISLLPVVDGEPCQEEHLPEGGVDSEGAAYPDDAAGDAGRPGAAAVDFESLIEAVGDLPVVCHRVGREIEPIRRACAAVGLPFHPVVISAAKLGHLLLGLKANHAAVDLAAALGVTTRGPDDCRGRVRTVAACYLKMTPLLEERGIDSIETLAEFQDIPATPIDLSGYAFTTDLLKELPAAPGVYRFLDRGGQVIYVGKARNLRARVASYFVPSARGTAKGRALLEQTHDLSIETCGSELEALLLEAALIAEHRPRLNRQFEVHERTAPYGPRLNLVVVLPDRSAEPAAATTCTLHFLRGGGYLGRESRVTPADAPWGRLAARLARAYFPGDGLPGAPGAASVAGPAAAGALADGPADEGGLDRGALQPVDVDWQLVGSFLRRHRDAVNVLDVDECVAAPDAIARLRVLITAACGPAGGRVLAR
jgi:hypothetical protein